MCVILSISRPSGWQKVARTPYSRAPPQTFASPISHLPPASETPRLSSNATPARAEGMEFQSPLDYQSELAPGNASTAMSHDTPSTVSSTDESATLPLPPPLKEDFAPLTHSDIMGLSTFVLFLGFGRTGHSIVGSLLDAHPDIIISHEYNVLKVVTPSLTKKEDWLLILFNKLYKSSHNSVVKGLRNEVKDSKGYTLGVKNSRSWQGQLRQLRAIGDKSGHMTVTSYLANKSQYLYLVHELNRVLGASVKVIRVIRNPYDIIATTFLIGKTGKSGLKNAKNSTQLNHTFSPEAIQKYIKRFSEDVDKTHQVVVDIPTPVHAIHLVDLIRQPHSIMREVCELIQVECSLDYLNLCRDKLYKDISKTRYLLQWSPQDIEAVANIMKHYPEYSRYSFDCDC